MLAKVGGEERFSVLFFSCDALGQMLNSSKVSGAATPPPPPCSRVTDSISLVKLYTYNYTNV